MFTGTPEEIRRKEAQATDLARDIADQLSAIERLGIGTVNGQISGTGFVIRRTGNGWTVSK